MSDFSFGAPWVLATIPAVLIAWGLWLRGSIQSGRAAATLSRRAQTGPSVVAPSLLAMAAVFAVLSAAQPRWGVEDAEGDSPGANIVIVFDVSRSMDAQDVIPSRLDVARDSVAEALSRLTGDRAGLVIFAGSARLRFPLTTDLDAAATVIRSLETGTLLVGQGTSTGDALSLAVETLGGDGGIVVLVTDGDDPETSAVQAVSAFRERNVELLIAPVGTAEGGTIPRFEGSTGTYVPVIDADRNPVITRLNGQFLADVAEAGGGTVLEGGAEALPRSLPAAAGNLRGTAFVTDATLPIERFQLFAVVAVAFGLAGLAWESLRPGRKTALLAATVAALGLLGACATDAYDLNEQALAAREAGDVEEAVSLFYDAAAEAPDDAGIAFNLATTLHEAERYREAVEAAGRMDSSPKASVRAGAHRLLGHHWFALGELDRSLEAFRQVLLIDSEDEVARRDYEVVYALLHQPPPDDGTEGPDGDGSTQQPSDDDDGDNSQTPVDSSNGDGETTVPRVRPAGEDELDDQLAEIDDAVEERLLEAGETVSAEEALEILTLLEERARLAALRDGLRSFNRTDH